QHLHPFPTRRSSDLCWRERLYYQAVQNTRSNDYCTFASKYFDDWLAMLPLHGLSTNDLEQMADEEFWNYARAQADTIPRVSSQRSEEHTSELQSPDH